MRSKHTALFILSFAFAVCLQPARAQEAINTFAGTGTGGYTGDGGAAGAAKLNNPTGVATFGFSNVYIADQANHVVRLVNSRGVISTFAGNDTAGNTGNGHAATAARLNTPHGVAVDASGNVYIADYSANVVRKVNTAGVISTVAGTGVGGYSGDGLAATAAKLFYPHSVAVDASGNLYIADANNNVIRKVNSFGIISTFAGNGFGAGTGSGGNMGDGGAATAAQLSFPTGVATDIFSNVYVADTKNNTVRKINASGVISTVAGTGAFGYSGDGGVATAAKLNAPAGVAADGPGNLFIADEGNNVIRKLATTGTITTFAGSISAGYGGDGGLATSAQLDAPTGIAVDGNGLVYVADYANNAVRLIGGAAGVAPVTGATAGIKVYPNPSTGSLNIEVPQTGSTSTVTLTDMLGRTVETRVIESTRTQKATLSINSIPPGNYVVKVTSAGLTSTREKVIVW